MSLCPGPAWLKARVRTTRSFTAWEGGGEYNTSRGLRKCFGYKTAVVTAFVDNEVGHLVEDFIMQGGVATDFKTSLPIPRATIQLLSPTGIVLMTLTAGEAIARLREMGAPVSAERVISSPGATPCTSVKSSPSVTRHEPTSSSWRGAAAVSRICGASTRKAWRVTYAEKVPCLMPPGERRRPRPWCGSSSAGPNEYTAATVPALASNSPSATCVRSK